MSVEFTIEGLTAQQKVLADIVWACDTKDQVEKFIAGLPTRALKTEVRTILELMVMAVVEQTYDGINPEMEQAQQVLQKYNKK